MTSLAVAFPGDTLIVQPWPDTVGDHTGHDPRSPYVEQFWLAVLGPSTTWLLRYFAAMFDRWPDGFEINLDDTARAIGLVNQTGRGSPFARALSRSVQFNLAQPFGFGLAVRRRVPPLSARQIQHLPAPLQSAHEAARTRRGSAVDRVAVATVALSSWCVRRRGPLGPSGTGRDRRRVALEQLDEGADAECGGALAEPALIGV